MPTREGLRGRDAGSGRFHKSMLERTPDGRRLYEVALEAAVRFGRVSGWNRAATVWALLRSTRQGCCCNA